MTKLLLYLLIALLMLPEAEAAPAEPMAPAATETELLVPPKVPRPSYKRYRGNSRRKYRRNVFRRMSAKRRAQQAKQKAKTAPPRRGVITVDPPVRNGVVN